MSKAGRNFAFFVDDSLRKTCYRLSKNNNKTPLKKSSNSFLKAHVFCQNSENNLIIFHFWR